MSRVILIFLLLFSLAPVWFMFTGSLQDSRGVFVMPPRPFPSNPTLINYKLLLSNPLLPRWCLNTLLIVVATTAASLCV
jgi:ABC-type glycerol-3-phosphate transport system permease component